MTTKTAPTHADISLPALVREVTGTYDYVISRDVFKPKVECDFVATDYNNRSYSARSCSNAAAWAESWNGTHIGSRRCHRHRAIDERTARNSAYRTVKTYIPFDAAQVATDLWREHTARLDAERLDAIADKVKVAAQYILNHVKTTGEGGRLDGTTLRVLRELTDDETRYTYDVR